MDWPNISRSGIVRVPRFQIDAPSTPNVARFARRMPELRYFLFLAEKDAITLCNNCGESFGATYRLAGARNSAFMDA